MWLRFGDMIWKPSGLSHFVTLRVFSPQKFSTARVHVYSCTYIDLLRRVFVCYEIWLLVTKFPVLSIEYLVLGNQIPVPIILSVGIIGCWWPNYLPFLLLLVPRNIFVTSAYSHIWLSEIFSICPVQYFKRRSWQEWIEMQPELVVD